MLESKKTDNSTVKEKQKEWENLTAEYNGQPEVSTLRSSSQLKMLWKNLKQKKRKQTTYEKHEALLTGGGPPPKKSEDPLMSLVENASPFMDVYLSNTFDSTSAFERRNTIHTSAEIHENLTTLTPKFNPGSSTNNDAIYKLPTNSPTIAVDDSPISFTEEQAPTPKTRSTFFFSETPLKRKASEEGYMRVKRIKTMVGADAELHAIRLEIANLEKLKAISDLNKSRYNEEIARITLEKLQNTI